MQWVQYSEWIVPVPVLFAIVWLNFNSPPTNRSGTTRALFSIGLTIYCFLIAVLWLLVIIAVGEGSIGFDKVSLALGTANPHAQAEFAQYAPLLAALMMVAATQVSWIRKIDNRARKFCIELAAIPREADRLALELAQTADFRPKSDRLRAKISEVVTETIGVPGRNTIMPAPSTMTARIVVTHWSAPNFQIAPVASNPIVDRR